MVSEGQKVIPTFGFKITRLLPYCVLLSPNSSCAFLCCDWDYLFGRSIWKLLYFVVCSIVIESLVPHNPVIGIKTVKSFLLDPKYIVGIFSSSVSPLFEGLKDTKAHLRFVFYIPSMSVESTFDRWHIRGSSCWKAIMTFLLFQYIHWCHHEIPR